jgi:Ni,Fe-hydrogenase III small subunit
MLDLLRRIRAVGRIAEPSSPPARTTSDAPSQPFHGSVQVRHVDVGSCNGCEVEIGAAFGPVYDAERYGVRLAASPRHADVLLVTGAVTRNMADPLRLTYEATPAPKRVIAFGDCARDCGVFAGAYGVEGAVADIVPVDVSVPGCPPSPEQLIEALRGFSGR